MKNQMYQKDAFVTVLFYNDFLFLLLCYETILSRTNQFSFSPEHLCILLIFDNTGFLTVKRGNRGSAGLDCNPPLDPGASRPREGRG